MKTTTIAIIAAGVLPLASFGQTPPAPPAPAAPAAPAAPPVPPHGPDRERDGSPKVPVTFLGVETSHVPTVVSDQLGLAKGFGLVVDYVVPDGPAAAAGVQQNDILKTLNEQILMEPDQLSKLVRSFPEGTAVTLTVLRKGAETKLSAKLGKRDVPQHRGSDGHGPHAPDFGALNLGDMNMGNFKEQMEKMRDELGNRRFGMSDEDRANLREQVRAAQESAREGARGAREGAREAAREARRAAQEMRIAQRENGAVKTTRIDIDKAEIVYRDEAGELKIENVDGKKVLTAKDPQGRLVFSGPVETNEELDKVPADVRQRYDKLEQKDLPNVVAPSVVSRDRDDADDEAADAEDADDNDADVDDDSDSEATEAVLQVSNAEDVTPVPYRYFSINTGTI